MNNGDTHLKSFIGAEKGMGNPEIIKTLFKKQKDSAKTK
jgi:hypothetical protein